MNRKYTIYCVDFDGTLCESRFPDIGKPNIALINHLIKRRKQGNKIILWTCRVNERLQEAVEWCKGYGLEFDAVKRICPKWLNFGAVKAEKYLQTFILTTRRLISQNIVFPSRR